MCEMYSSFSAVVRMTNDCLLHGYSLYFLFFLKSFVHTWTLHFCTTILHLCNNHKRFYPKKSHTITHQK
jgi:hypothetical protein